MTYYFLLLLIQLFKRTIRYKEEEIKIMLNHMLKC